MPRSPSAPRTTRACPVRCDIHTVLHVADCSPCDDRCTNAECIRRIQINIVRCMPVPVLGAHTGRQTFIRPFQYQYQFKQTRAFMNITTMTRNATEWHSQLSISDSYRKAAEQVQASGTTCSRHTTSFLARPGSLCSCNPMERPAATNQQRQC